MKVETDRYRPMITPDRHGSKVEFG